MYQLMTWAESRTLILTSRTGWHTDLVPTFLSILSATGFHFLLTAGRSCTAGRKKTALAKRTRISTFTISVMRSAVKLRKVHASRNPRGIHHAVRQPPFDNTTGHRILFSLI